MPTATSAGVGSARTARDRPSALPSWAAVCAWGAGLVCLALGAGTVTGGPPSARTAGVVVAVAGAAALAWGVVVLARGRIVAPRAAIAATVALIAALGIAVIADPTRVSVIAAGAASGLLLAVALLAGVRLRRGGDASGAPRVSALLLAGIVVAGVVTPALGATEAARLAPDHGTHGVVDPGHH